MGDDGLQYDPDVNYDEDDEPRELIRDIAARSPDMISVEPQDWGEQKG